MLRGWVALTGTPGVGKTATADHLRRRGVLTVELGRFAPDYDLVEGVDPLRMSAIVDPKRVGVELRRVLQAGALAVLEGHWSHEVPGVTAVIVLRLRPRDLRERLRRRGWPEAKIRENLEAEAVGVCLHEALDRLPQSAVFESDTTGRDAAAVADDVHRLLRGTTKEASRFRPGRVDWSSEVLAWY